MPDAHSELAARVAAARERFLAAGEAVAGTVREQILNSWRRSRFSGVDVDHIDPPYRTDIDFDNRLVRSATPVLERLERELTDEPMTVVLTDPEAWVLDRRSGDRALRRNLDKVSLSPGFSYAEEYVGTNGIGTALEEQSSAWVFGPEHFSERLQSLSCAGAVIRNPLRGRIEGLIDLTCWRGEASPLMRVLVQEAARDVSERLVELESERERALLNEFIAACRRTNNPILSLNDDLVISNSRGIKLLDPSDHAALRERATELLRSAVDTTADLQLPSGRTVRLQSRQVSSRAGVAGALVEVQTLGRSTRRRLGQMPRYLPLAGVAGRSGAWLHACEEAITACERHSPLLLVGEAGAGKLALAKAVHRRWFPAERLRIIEGPGTGDPGAWIADLRLELDKTTGTIILRRVDQLDEAAAELLAGALGALETTSAWVVATSASQDLPAPLLERLSVQVSVPPLRYRIEDLHELVPFLLDRLAPGADVRCSPEALQVLLHNQWPGNVGQLTRALGVAVGRCRGGRIESADLPPECHTVTRQVLTRWQWIERDAIVDALVEAKGNRTEAAAKLGMSRATIYRRINAFGIRLAGLHD
jgi:sigma-54 dependent transcriptional regulator, acetoin dehydrogenase operon transcriptional activator AcoR